MLSKMKRLTGLRNRMHGQGKFRWADGRFYEGGLSDSRAKELT